MSRSSVIDFLKSSTTKQGSTVIYYYCDYSQVKTLEPPNIIGTLIKKLLYNVDIPTNVEQEIDNAFRQPSRGPEVEDLQSVLDLVVMLFPKVYIVIDGLDECRKEDQALVLSAMKRLAPITTTKLFISSREDDLIKKALSGCPQIDFSAANVGRDIESFVEGTVKSKLQSRELAISNPCLEQEIISALVDGASGMYILQL